LTAFSHICAFVLMFLIALGQGAAFPSRASVLWAFLAGAIGGFSLAIFYRALASGQMSVTAPIAALLGAAIPALADIALEGAPRRWTMAGFVVAIVAIWLITRPEQTSLSANRQPVQRPDGIDVEPQAWSRETEGEERMPEFEPDSSGHPKGVALAALAGVGFAAFYLCIHQAHGSSAWIAVVARVGSFIATAIAVVATRAPLALDRFRVALGAFAGFLDISASALFVFASQRGRLDEAVVITSLYPAVTVLLARLVLKEHLSRWRFVGLLAALVAVPMIAAG
jgi:drug/metabolite transporter (DMT)-like permease